MSVATQHRSALDIRKRMLVDFSFRALRFACKKIRGKPGAAKKVLLFPCADNAQQLANLLNRLSWYLPENSGVQITLPYSAKISPADLSEAALKKVVPSSQHIYLKLHAGIHLQPQISAADIDHADQILLWQASALPRLGTSISKAIMVDPQFFSSVESSCWAESIYRSLTDAEKEERLNRYKKNFSALAERVRPLKRANIFTTGPSMDKSDQLNIQPQSFQIICNSIVKNKELMRRIRPQLLVFADPVFHYSPCRYDAEFRRLAQEAVEEHDLFVMTTENRAPLLQAHFPQWRDRIIGMPVKNLDEVNFPTLEKFYTTNTRNIMTLFMVPVASALSKEVTILGADGRQRGENYFWKHSTKNQMHDLMDTAIDTHPSFFRDRDYKDYYQYHCSVVAAQIAKGEALGLRYQSLTPSYIPALEARQVNL